MRWILTCSLFLIFSRVFPQSASEWLERLFAAEKVGDEAVTHVLREMEAKAVFPDVEWKTLVSETLSERERGRLEELKDHLEFYSQWEKEGASRASETVRGILKAPVFREVREEDMRENWLARALDRLAELFSPSSKRRQTQSHDLTLPTSPRGSSFLFYAAWVFLGTTLLIACGALWIHVRHQQVVGTKKTKARRSQALLNTEEESLTLDEWLERAKQFESLERLREAYRCLYISLLMTLARERFIRWEPWETNWEHLRKIETSPAPGEVQYRTLTELFDHIWYGERPPSLDEWLFAKEQYQHLCEKIRSPA